MNMTKGTTSGRMWVILVTQFPKISDFCVSWRVVNHHQNGDQKAVVVLPAPKFVWQILNTSDY